MSSTLTDSRTGLEEARRRMEVIQSRIADVLYEIDDILLQINPQIQADYALKIGCWENELVKAQLEARRAKRKAELAQARVNSGQTISDEECESILDEEFAAWEAELKAAVEAYVGLIERKQNSTVMSPADSRELKRLHRTLVKRLHPDLNPNLSGTEAQMFLIAQKAFETGDIETLRSIEVATSSLEQEQSTAYESEDAAVAEAELLEAYLALQEERLNGIKQSKPYSLMDNLADAQWVCEKVDDLKEQIEQQREAKRLYDLKYEKLVKEAEDER